MQWIFLIGDAPLSLSSFSGMQFPGSSEIIRSDQQLTVRYAQDGYAILHQAEGLEDMKSEFEPEELEKLLHVLPFENPKWMMLQYSDIEIAKQILQAPDFPQDVFIDCDGVNPGLETVFDADRIIGTALPDQL